MYLRPTVPAMSRAVHVLATATNIWQSKHARALLRIGLWLAASQNDTGVFFGTTYRGRFELRAFVDESLGCELSRNGRGAALSRLGGFLLLNGGCICSASHRAAATCYSTAEIALLAISLLVRRLVPIRRLLRLADGVPVLCTDLRCDNQPVLKQLRRRQLSPQMRHFRIAMNGILAAEDSYDVICKYIRSKINPANTFTSPEAGALFRRNAAFISGQRDPTLPDFTTLKDAALKQYLDSLKKVEI